MDPVVPGRSFERFARVDRTAGCFLLHTPPSTSFLNDLAFDPFLLALTVRLLLVRRSQRFHQLLSGVLDRTKHTFVCCGHLKIVIVPAHVTKPWLGVGLVPDTIA
jgi:hypothetical protein